MNMNSLLLGKLPMDEEYERSGGKIAFALVERIKRIKSSERKGPQDSVAQVNQNISWCHYVLRRTVLGR